MNSKRCIFIFEGVWKKFRGDEVRNAMFCA